MRTLLIVAAAGRGLGARARDRARPVQENRPANQGRRRGGQGRMEISRRQDRRGRGQGPRRQAQQDVQHRAQGREARFRRQQVGGGRSRDPQGPALRRARSASAGIASRSRFPPEAAGKAVFFQTTVDDYGEVWVDGKLPRTPGKGGEAIVAGFNAPNRVELKDPQPGQGLSDRRLRHQRADLGRSVQLAVPQEHCLWKSSTRSRSRPVGPGLCVAPFTVLAWSFRRLPPAAFAIRRLYPFGPRRRKARRSVHRHQPTVSESKPKCRFRRPSCLREP